MVVELTQYNSYHSFSNVMPKIYVQICETVLHAQSVKNDSNNIEIEYALTAGYYHITPWSKQTPPRSQGI